MDELTNMLQVAFTKWHKHGRLFMEKSVLSAQMAKSGVYCAKYKALCE